MTGLFLSLFIKLVEIEKESHKFSFEIKKNALNNFVNVRTLCNNINILILRTKYI